MRPRTKHKIRMTFLGWAAALLIAFPIFWMTLAAFKTEIVAVATPPQLFFSPTLENFAEVQSRGDYPVFAVNSIVISVGATAHRDSARPPGVLCDGVPPVEKDQGSSPLDAVDQNDAGRRRPDPDLSDVQGPSPARHDLRSDHHLYSDESADRRLDDLFLLQATCRRRSWRRRAWTARGRCSR